MPRLTEEDLARLLRNNPDVSTDTPTHTPKAIIVKSERVNAYPEKRSKYGNRKVTVDGLTFDSQREYRRFLELRGAAERGEITDLELQPRFTLMEAWRGSDGVRHRVAVYIADFKYRQDGLTIVEDVKSKPTAINALFRMKWKWVQYIYRNNPKIVFRLVF